MISFLKDFHRDQDGAVAAIVAVMLFVLLGFAAAAIDMSYANSTRTELQVTASAAALAGVSELVDDNDDAAPDNDDYRIRAVEFAYRNMATSDHGNVLQATCGTYDPVGGTVGGSAECDDVKAGDWNPNTRIFTAWTEGATELDAVLVRAHRNQTNGNPLGLFLAPVVGLAEQDINVSAIAWGAPPTGDDCYQRGVIAEEWVDMDSTNTFVEGVCIYGDRGVKYQSDNCMQGGYNDPDPESCGEPITTEYGTEVMTCDGTCERGPGEWDEQGGPNPGMDDAKAYGDRDPELAKEVAGFIGAAEAGFGPGTWTAPYNYELFADPCDPAAMCNTETSIPGGGPQTGHAYQVNGTVDLPKGNHTGIAIMADIIKLQSDSSISNSILVAQEEIVIDGDVRNSVIASRDLVKLGSNIVVGNPEVKCPDNINVAIYSEGKFTIQSNATVANTQLITGYSLDVLDLQSNNNYLGVAIQSMGNINLGSDNYFKGCPEDTLEGPSNETTGVVYRLVD